MMLVENTYQYDFELFLKHFMIILITGKAGSGKSTLAAIFEEHGFKNVALADKLKEFTYKCLQVFGIKIDSLKDLYEQSTKTQYRTYLQKLGTECFRETFGDDFWCDVLMNDIRDAPNVVISDIRYENEIEYFKQRFECVVVKIVRNNSILTDSQQHHSSEIGIRDELCDVILNNNSSIESLRTFVSKFLK